MVKLILLAFTIAYAYTLCQLPDTSYKDFDNYLNYASNSLLIFSLNLENGLLTTLSNEPAWLLLNSALALNFAPESTIRIIIFFSAFTMAWSLLRQNPIHFIWIILFLFLPQIIKNFLIHLRQGTAIAIFLWGWFSVNRCIRWLFLVFSPLVHASFFFILVLMWLAWLLNEIRFDSVLQVITLVTVSALAGIGTGWLAQTVGARQGGEYVFQAKNFSGLGFLLWFVILAIIFMAGRSYLRRHTFEIGIIIFYLVTYWLLEVSARIFESGLLLVLLAGLMLPGWRKQLFIAAVLGSGTVQWLMQLGQPTLGFGVG